MTENTTDPRRPKPVAAPALVIRLELESRARAIVEARDEEEQDRLYDWLRSREDLVELARLALDTVETLEVRQGPAA